MEKRRPKAGTVVMVVLLLALILLVLLLLFLLLALLVLLVLLVHELTPLSTQKYAVSIRPSPPFYAAATA